MLISYFCSPSIRIPLQSTPTLTIMEAVVVEFGGKVLHLIGREVVWVQRKVLVLMYVCMDGMHVWVVKVKENCNSVQQIIM